MAVIQPWQQLTNNQLAGMLTEVVRVKHPWVDGMFRYNITVYMDNTPTFEDRVYIVFQYGDRTPMNSLSMKEIKCVTAIPPFRRNLTLNDYENTLRHGFEDMVEAIVRELDKSLTKPLPRTKTISKLVLRSKMFNKVILRGRLDD